MSFLNNEMLLGDSISPFSQPCSVAEESLGLLDDYLEVAEPLGSHGFSSDKAKAVSSNWLAVDSLGNTIDSSQEDAFSGMEWMVEKMDLKEFDFDALLGMEHLEATVSPDELMATLEDTCDLFNATIQEFHNKELPLINNPCKRVCRSNLPNYTHSREGRSELEQDAQLVSQSWEGSQQPDELSEHAALARQQWDTSLHRRLQMRGKEMLSSRFKGCCGLQPISFQCGKQVGGQLGKAAMAAAASLTTSYVFHQAEKSDCKEPRLQNPFGLEGALENIPFPPPCQGHLCSKVAQIPILPGLKHLQG